MGLFDHLKQGLSKTKQAFVDKATEIFTGKKPIDDELFDELEEAMIQADVGVKTAMSLVDSLRRKAREEKLEEAWQLRGALEKEIEDMLRAGDHSLHLEKGSLHAILVVGVNGAGKTTSIGKLCYRLKNDSYKVLVAAGDTFRAAAIDQLEVWCKRAGIDLVRHSENSDPGAVVFDSLQAAKSRKMDVVVIDTAGRLQTKTNLIEELKKIRRVIEREIPASQTEVLLVLDAATGQNALSQAKLFSEAVQVSGVILTKLDGTAKGGVILGIQHEYGLPVKFIGTGEKIDDLHEFDPEVFARAMFNSKEENINGAG